MFIFFYLKYIELKGQGMERERREKKKETERLNPYVVPLPKCLQQPELGQVETKSL